VIGGKAGGVLTEILKHPVSAVDYLELDREFISLYKRYASPELAAGLSDPRVRVIFRDARDFLSRPRRVYDVILIAGSLPHDLLSARFFSREFFLQCRRSLREGGIVALRLPGSFVHVSPQLVDINLSIYHALASAFTHTRLIAGDNNLFLAGLDPGVSVFDADIVVRRLVERAIEVKLLVPGYIRLRMDKDSGREFAQAAHAAHPLTNQDARPAALFYALVYWTKQFNPGLGAIVGRAGGMRLRHMLFSIGALFIAGAAACSLKKKGCSRAALVYAAATTGFFGMLSSLVLVFGFQVRFGYIYKGIGFLLALFMAGIASGSFLVEKRLSGSRGVRTLILAIETSMAVFAVLLFPAAAGNGAYSVCGMLLVASAFFCCGLFLGLEFPLLCHLYLKQGKSIGSAAGRLYAADLAGGCIAGLLGGVILVPVIGLSGCAATLGALKLSSLILLSVSGGKGLAEDKIAASG